MPLLDRPRLRVRAPSREYVVSGSEEDREIEWLLGPAERAERVSPQCVALRLRGHRPGSEREKHDRCSHGGGDEPDPSADRPVHGLTVPSAAEDRRSELWEQFSTFPRAVFQERAHAPGSRERGTLERCAASSSSLLRSSG